MPSLFHKGGRFPPVCRCSYNGQIIEVVTSFNYLGIVLSNRGSFIHATNTFAAKGLRAMGSLLHVTKQLYVPIAT